MANSAAVGVIGIPDQGVSTSGKYLKSDGSSVAFDQLDISTADVTGVLPVANGGTGASTLTGLVKGNGAGNMSAAVSGIDYAPATSGSAILKGNGSGGFSSIVSGTDIKTINSTSILGSGDIQITSPTYLDFTPYNTLQYDETSSVFSGAAGNNVKNTVYSSTYGNLVGLFFDSSGSRWMISNHYINSNDLLYTLGPTNSWTLSSSGGSATKVDAAIIPLDGTRCLGVYSGNTPSSFVTTSSASSLSKGTEVSLTNTTYNVGLELIDVDTVLAVYLRNGTTGSARVLTVSGTTVTVNTEYAMGFGNAVQSSTRFKVCKLTTTKAVTVWQNGSGFWVGVIDRSGTSLSFGTNISLGGAAATDCLVTPLSSTKFFFAYLDTNYVRGVVCTVSGTNVSVGTPIIIHPRYDRGFEVETNLKRNAINLIGNTINVCLTGSGLSPSLSKILWDGNDGLTLTGVYALPGGLNGGMATDFINAGQKIYGRLTNTNTNYLFYRAV